MSTFDTFLNRRQKYAEIYSDRSLQRRSLQTSITQSSSVSRLGPELGLRVVRLAVRVERSNRRRYAPFFICIAMAITLLSTDVCRGRSASRGSRGALATATVVWIDEHEPELHFVGQTVSYHCQSAKLSHTQKDTTKPWGYCGHTAVSARELGAKSKNPCYFSTTELPFNFRAPKSSSSWSVEVLVLVALITDAFRTIIWLSSTIYWLSHWSKRPMALPGNRQPVAAGGFMSSGKVAYSEETQKLLKGNLSGSSNLAAKLTYIKNVIILYYIKACPWKRCQVDC